MNGKPVFTVPSKTIINFKSGFAAKLLCDGPTFSAGTSCAYSCAFCYVPAVMHKQTGWLKGKGVEGDHMDVVVRRENAAAIAEKQLRSKSKAERDKKLVIYASPLVDVAANMELVRETVEICKVILSLTNWDIRLLSKSTFLPKIAEGLEAAAPIGHWTDGQKWMSRVIYGVSTGTMDDKLAQAFEQGCPLVSKRIESLHWLQDRGYRTFAMVCPSLPMSSLEAIRYFANECSEKLRYEKCEHVWAEVINVRGESFKRTITALESAGFREQAHELRVVMSNTQSWEQYARDTFLAHFRVTPAGKLRFLQYVNKNNREFWSVYEKEGAVLL